MTHNPFVILANGNFPKHRIPVDILKNAKKIICCDGSINELNNMNIVPDYIIGDMDSINLKNKNKYIDKIIKITDQTENDLRKAIRWAEKKVATSIKILGATGKRDDHSIANIFTLLEFPNLSNIMIYTDYGYFSTLIKSKNITSFKGQQVSLFAKDENIKISTKNLKYNLNNNTLNTLYSGSLNESSGNNFTIKISHGKIILFQTFK